MRNPVGYFEIPVVHMERAIVFYQRVFDDTFERTTIDGNPMAFFRFDPNASGITGALAQGDSYVPGKQGPRIYFKADDIEETLRKVEAAGGKVTYPKTSVGEYGWVAEFEDSEGNLIALQSE
jgi:uncharacterized protein